MDEHRIRLRGGWECQSTASAEEPPERIALPVRWDPGNPRRLRLTRRFGRPPVDLERQTLLLELAQARGIHSLLLNGKAQSGVSASKSYYLIPLAEIDERNTLVLEVETAESAVGAGEGVQDWGQIAILVRSIDFPP